MPYNRSSFDKEQFEEIIKSPNYDDIHAIIHSFNCSYTEVNWSLKWKYFKENCSVKCLSNHNACYSILHSGI